MCQGRFSQQPQKAGINSMSSSRKVETGMDWLCSLLKVIYLESGEARIPVQPVWLQTEPCSHDVT